MLTVNKCGMLRMTQEEKEEAELMADEERRHVSEMIELVDEIDSATEKTKKLVDRIEFLFITVSLLDLVINIATYIVIWISFH